MHFSNHCLGEVGDSYPQYTNHFSANWISLNRLPPNRLAQYSPALNHLVLNRLAGNPPAPLLKISASMTVEISTGLITQVRVHNL